MEINAKKKRKIDSSKSDNNRTKISKLNDKNKEKETKEAPSVTSMSGSNSSAATNPKDSNLIDKTPFTSAPTNQQAIEIIEIDQNSNNKSKKSAKFYRLNNTNGTPAWYAFEINASIPRNATWAKCKVKLFFMG